MSELYTSENILSRMLDYTEDGYDKSAGGFIYDVQKPAAMEMSAYHTRIENLNDKHCADTATGDDLDKYVKEYGVVRKSATFASGEVTFYGEPGATISVGDRVADRNGLLFYTTTAGVVDENGECTVKIICASATSKGNIEAGAITKIPITIKGITSVTNLNPTVGGSSTETDTELRERFYERMKYKNVPGSKAWYEIEALSVEGVGDAKCIPTWNGGGTVKLIILNDDMQPADDVIIQRVYEHFSDPIIGTTLTVTTVETLNINISVTIISGDGFDLERTKTEFSDKVTEYLRTISYDGGTIYIKQIGMKLLEISGVEDYENLMLNDNTVNIVISADDNCIPVLGGVTFG